MLPLVPAREQQNHDVLQHAGLGHGQHDDDIDMNLDNMLPLQQVFDLDRQDDMLEDGDRQLREQKGNMKMASCFSNLQWMYAGIKSPEASFSFMSTQRPLLHGTPRVFVS